MERFVKINFKGADPDGLSAIPPEIYRDRYDVMWYLVEYLYYMRFVFTCIYINRFIRRMEELLDIDESDVPKSADSSNRPTQSATGIIEV